MEDDIQNWQIYPSPYVQIQIFENEDDIYSGMLMFIISETQNITFEVSLEHTDKDKLIKMIFTYASILFTDILPEVIIMDSTGEITETVNLKDYILRPEGSLLH